MCLVRENVCACQKLVIICDIGGGIVDVVGEQFFRVIAGQCQPPLPSNVQ